MSALAPIPPPRPFLLRDGRYRDEAHPSSLLSQTCLEQQGRLHALRLLTDYLPRSRGLQRQLLETEARTLGELYEAVWGQLECAFESGSCNSHAST
jgi:hypothetical protein